MANNKRLKGSGSYSANFEPKVTVPLDGRQLVENIPQLLNSESWTEFVFKGMIVGVADVGVLYASLTTEQKNTKIQENGKDTENPKYVADTNGYAYDAETNLYLLKGKGAVYMLKDPANISSLSNGWQLVGESDDTIQDIGDLQDLVNDLKGEIIIHSKIAASDWTETGSMIKVPTTKFSQIKTDGKGVHLGSGVAADATGLEIPLATESNGGAMSKTDKQQHNSLWADKPSAIRADELDLLCAQAELDANGYAKKTVDIVDGETAVYDATSESFKIGTSQFRLNNNPVEAHIGDEVNVDSTPAHNLVIYEIESGETPTAFMHKKNPYVWQKGSNATITYNSGNQRYEIEDTGLVANGDVQPSLYDTVEDNGYVYYIFKKVSSTFYMKLISQPAQGE